MSAPLLAEVAALLLVSARVAGFIVTSPFPGKSTPSKVKIGLVLVLAWIARGAAPPPPSLGLDLALIGLVPSELGIGLVIGFTVRVTFSAAEILGVSFAQSTGLTMGSVYDPTSGGDEPVVARVMTLCAMLLFLSLGAHRVAIGYALESFRALPVGVDAEIGAAAPSLVAWFSQALDAGVHLALPVTAIALAVQVALALIARASPSLQIFSIGLGITVAAGLLAILGALGDAAAGLGDELGQSGARIEQILGAIAP